MMYLLAQTPKATEFSLEQLKHQTYAPVVTIDTTKPLCRGKLSGIYKKITQKAKREATEFVQRTTPILPQDNSLASIDLRGAVMPNVPTTVKICFELKSLYIKGVLVREVFYELRKTDNPTWLVDGSIALECRETYYEMFGRQDNPTVDLSDTDLVEAFNSFVKLTPTATRKLFQDAARSIGLISLILIEPARQWDVMYNMCSGPKESTWYFTMSPSCWTSIHSWNTRSKIAKGIQYKDGEIEEKLYEPEKRIEAIANVRIVNSTKKLPIKKIVC